MTQSLTGVFQQLGTLGKYARFVVKNMNAVRAMKQLYTVRTNFSRANMEIARLSWSDPLYAQRVDEFNETMIVLTQAKWKTACAMEALSRSHSRTKIVAQQYWREAKIALKQSLNMSQQLLNVLQITGTLLTWEREA